MTQDSTKRLLDAVAEIRKIDSEMPVQTLAAFLWIAAHEGRHQVDMREALDFGISQTSRTVLRLSNERGGLGLIDSTIDPAHRSHRQLWLTPNGKRLVLSLQARLNQE